MNTMRANTAELKIMEEYANKARELVAEFEKTFYKDMCKTNRILAEEILDNLRFPASKLDTEITVFKKGNVYDWRCLGYSREGAPDMGWKQIPPQFADN